MNDLECGTNNIELEHVEKEWDAFVKQQQDQTLAKLDRIDDSKKELDDIRLLLSER